MYTCFILVFLLPLLGCGDDSESNPPVPTEPITARMLVEPGALAGPGPSSFAWSPTGASLAYVAPVEDGGADVLWLYEATTGTRRVLPDPSGQDDSIDVNLGAVVAAR
jgi:hypothetical protein